MSVKEKVKSLLSKEWRTDYWDCYNDSPNSEEWMREQEIENSLILVDEQIMTLDRLCQSLSESDAFDKVNLERIFWNEVKIELKRQMVCQVKY